MIPQALVQFATKIERQLAGFYGFDLLANVADHILTPDQVRAAIPHISTQNLSTLNGQGSLWAVQDQEPQTTDLFLAVTFSQHVRDAFAGQNLDDFQVSSSTLNVASVIIEEVSHFHLVAQRAKEHRSVTQLELEWQGEIDKLLICGQILDAQQGDPHVVPLARMLYDCGEIYAANHELYWNAQKYAARFWFAVAVDAGAATKEFRSEATRSILRRAYVSSWQEKLQILRQPLTRRAS